MAALELETDGEVLTLWMGPSRVADETTIRDVQQDLMAILEERRERKVLLHFGRVSFMSSSAFGMLIRIRKKCSDRKTWLKFCSVPGDVRKLFEITGLDEVFEIHPDAADAIRAFAHDDPPGGTGVFAKIKRPPSGGTAARDIEPDDQ